MKYICASCKTVYNENELNIDPMSGIQICPKCGKIGSGMYSEEKLASKINDYMELFQILNESSDESVLSQRLDRSACIC